MEDKKFNNLGKVNSLGKWLDSVHLLAAVITIIAALASLFSSSSRTTHELILLSTLCIYVLSLTILMFYSSYTNGYKARYSDSATKIHYALHRLRDAYKCMHESRSYKNRLQESMDGIADSFSLITGTYCRVLVRLLDAQGEKLITRTFVRDKTSTEKYKKIDAIENNSGETTQFLRLYTPYHRIIS